MSKMIQAIILVSIVLAIIPCAVQAQRAVAVATDGGQVLVLMDDGTVYSLESTDNPQKVPIDNVMAVSMGSSVSLALRSDGTVWAWGDNFYGELGDGSLNSSNMPVRVKGLTNVVATAAGGDGACYALKDDGTV